MLKRISVLILTMYFFSYHSVLAHPGNTDSSGGHTCRTNCEKWGLNYGEYHHHNSSPVVDDYNDGYNRGYEYAYAYTEQCQEEYDWWWEGPQRFGDGYEKGIHNGHEDGLEVCYRESIQMGYDWGYSDYEDGYEYDDSTEDFDEVSFVDGYSDGWSDAETEEIDYVSDSNNPIYVESPNFEDNDLDEEKVFEEALYLESFDAGFNDAREDYMYGDTSSWLTEEKNLRIYKKGYRIGWYEGGGNFTLPIIVYLLFQKYLWWTIGVMVALLSGLAWFGVKKRQTWLFKNSIGKKNLI